MDGLTRGAVVDYLTSPLLDRVHLLLSTQSFPIFNGADMLVLAGVVLLVLTPAPAPRCGPRETTCETPGPSRSTRAVHRVSADVHPRCHDLRLHWRRAPGRQDHLP
ncbi:signal peptidase II [Deinococcus metalli]|uniref:signal peptidase II n=1 Tax=Deinococcus metalli TaxID=1141878 RepID=UPI00361485C1